MKKFFIFIALLICSLCYSEELKMNEKLKDGMNYYFEKLIPSYYAGNLDTREERNNIVEDLNNLKINNNEWKEEVCYEKESIP